VNIHTYFTLRLLQFALSDYHSPPVLSRMMLLSCQAKKMTPLELFKSKYNNSVLDFQDRRIVAVSKNYLAARDKLLIYTWFRNSRGIERCKYGWPEKRASLTGESEISVKGFPGRRKKLALPYKSTGDVSISKTRRRVSTNSSAQPRFYSLPTLRL